MTDLSVSSVAAQCYEIKMDRRRGAGIAAIFLAPVTFLITGMQSSIGIIEVEDEVPYPTSIVIRRIGDGAVVLRIRYWRLSRARLRFAELRNDLESLPVAEFERLLGIAGSAALNVRSDATSVRDAGATLVRHNRVVGRPVGQHRRRGGDGPRGPGSPQEDRATDLKGGDAPWADGGGARSRHEPSQTADGREVLVCAYPCGIRDSAVERERWLLLPSPARACLRVAVYLRYRIRFGGAWVVEIRDPEDQSALGQQLFRNRALAETVVPEVSRRLASLPGDALSQAWPERG